MGFQLKNTAAPTGLYNEVEIPQWYIRATTESPKDPRRQTRKKKKQEINMSPISDHERSKELDSNLNSPVYEIETKRLLFRRLQESDAEPYHEILSNHDAMRYWSREPHTEISQTVSFLSKPTNPDMTRFALCLKSSSPTSSPKLIGTMGVFQNEIWYMLDPSYWRQGIGSEAMEAFLEFFWRTWPKVNSLKANVDPRNIASSSLLKKFGFVETGWGKETHDTHIGLCDSIYYRLDRPKENPQVDHESDEEILGFETDETWLGCVVF